MERLTSLWTACVKVDKNSHAQAKLRCEALVDALRNLKGKVVIVVHCHHSWSALTTHVVTGEEDILASAQWRDVRAMPISKYADCKGSRCIDASLP